VARDVVVGVAGIIQVEEKSGEAFSRGRPGQVGRRLPVLEHALFGPDSNSGVKEKFLLKTVFRVLRVIAPRPNAVNIFVPRRRIVDD
jgi:hypothetical protein